MDNQLSLATLNSLSGWELEKFLQINDGEEVSQMITKAVYYYKTMIKELQDMEDTIPDLLDDVKTIQQKVDKRHKNVNIATIGGCATSIFGSVLISGWITAAPFTFGATIGLTVAGTVVAAGGSSTTAIARTVDYVMGRSDLKKTNKMVDECRGHYQAAKEAYEALNQIFQKLIPMLPASESETAKSKIFALVKAVASKAEFAFGCGYRLEPVITGGKDAALTVQKAVVSPKRLHADTLAVAHSTKAVVLSTRQLMSDTLRIAKSVVTLDSGGLRLAVMASFWTVGSIIKAGGILFTIGGIVYDAYSLISAGRELHSGKKCKVSQEISKHIEELEELRNKLRILKQQLAENVKPITD